MGGQGRDEAEVGGARARARVFLSSWSFFTFLLLVEQRSF